MQALQDGELLGGQYRIEAKLGEGGMAVVYRAFDLQRQAAVAVKALKPDFAEDTTFLHKFKREARNLERLNHPNIVRFYEIHDQGLLAFIVLDFIDGLTLRATMRQRGRPFSPGEALGYLRPVSAALSYAHRQGVVHCDLKPANVMIDRAGRVFVNDFGIARVSESATVTFSTPGTPAYMAPEQWRGGDEVYPATDIYALGVMLYEMLAGRQPFIGEAIQTKGHTREKIMQEHLSLPPPLASQLYPQLPHAFDDILLRCLAKKYTDRYQSIEALLADFEAACGGRQAEVPVPRPIVGEPSGTTTAPPPAQTKAPSVRRNVTVFGGMGALVTIGCIALTILGVLVLAMSGAAKGGQFASTPTLQQVAAVTATNISEQTSVIATSTPVVVTAVRIVTVPATDTPQPTNTPNPTPTSPPTATVATCAVLPSGAFAAVWSRYQNDLGCPKFASPRFIADAEQLFQNGHMFWRGDIDVYYVVYDAGGPTGSWSQYGSKYNDGGLAACGESPPSGLVKPESGFGNVWCGIGGANAPIGWGRDRQYGFVAGQTVRVQDFDKGAIFQDSDGAARGLVYVLFKGGRFVRERP